VVIDEIQRVPEVLLPIKAAVGRDRQPGRFLLTGSANVLLLPRLADTLAGRMQVITLRPLSQGEMAGSHERFLIRLFDAGEWAEAG
jgi:predicted AAA+ superfamily ATPase